MLGSPRIRTPAENIAQAILQIEAIRRFLVPAPPASGGDHYLARLAFYGLMCRVVELGDASAKALLATQLAAGALLSRATGETTAVTYMLASKAQSVTSDAEKQELDAVARKVVTASRYWADDMAPATNILTLIDRLDKEINSFRILYDVLSEYAHPNATGLFAAVADDCCGLDGKVEAATKSARDLGLSTSALFLRVSVAKALTLTTFADLPVLRFRCPGAGGVES